MRHCIHSITATLILSAVAALNPATANAASPGSILGEYCAGTGNADGSKRIITQIVMQNGKLFARHIDGDHALFPNAIAPQPGMTEDRTLHPVSIEGIELTYVSDRASTIRLTPRSASDVEVKIVVSGPGNVDYYDAVCHPANPG